MKFKYLMLIIITVFINMYLIFMWNPNTNSEDAAISTYKNESNISSDQLGEDSNKLESGESLYLNQINLLEDINEDDMKELNNILNKLSTSDLSKWIEVKQDENDENLIEFFKLIKKRMSPDDYEKVKRIIGKNLDVDRIETIILHNYM